MEHMFLQIKSQVEGELNNMNQGCAFFWYSKNAVGPVQLSSLGLLLEFS